MKEKTLAVKKKTVKKTTTKKVVAKKIVVNKKDGKVAKNIGDVQLKLFLADGELSVNGKTVTECLNKLNPGQIKSKGTFIIFVGKKKAECVVPFSSQIKRLLLGKMSKVIFEKKMLGMLK